MNWPLIQLRRMARIRNGSDHSQVVDPDGAFPVYGSGGEFARSVRPLYEGPAVLLGRKGTIDKPLLVDGKFWTVDTMFCAEPLPGTEPRFLYYACTTIPFKLLSTSTALPSMTQGDLNSVRLPCPPLKDQVAAADFLDRETAKIDALIDKQEQLITTLREQRTATITDAITKGLDPDVELTYSGVEWLGDIPSHWHVVPMKHVVSSVGVGLVINPSTYVAESGVPFLLGRNVRDGWIDLTDVNYMSEENSRRLKASRLKAGDVVVMRVGYPGRAAVVTPELDGANCASVLILRQPTQALSDLVSAFFNSSVGRVQVELAQYGAAQDAINLGDVVDFVMPVPPMSEQVEIVRRISAKSVAIDELITKAEEMIGVLREYRSALITDAVTGKIDVRGAA